MAITIKDVARAAGVSHTTVSRALRGSSAISAETTARIQSLAQQMGYVPSAVAQSLISRRTRTIGMVVTTIADPFIVEIVEGAESVAQAAGYSLFLASSHNDPDREVKVVETFHRRRVDAIIVTSSRVGSLYSSQLDQIAIPIVLINNQEEGEYLYSVSVNDVHGAHLVVEHLYNLGHRRIGYIGTNTRPKSNRRRLTGYQTALAQLGLTPDPALVLSPDIEADVDRAKAVLDALVAAGATAVFCYNDLTAVGLLMACCQREVKVPGDLSVAGFDDIEIASYVTPALTTVRQPRSQLGAFAMSMALNLLNGKQVHDQTLEGELIVRKSTGRPIIQ